MGPNMPGRITIAVKLSFSGRSHSPGDISIVNVLFFKKGGNETTYEKLTLSLDSVQEQYLKAITTKNKDPSFFRKAIVGHQC